jgi:hypothetical protein
MTQTPKLVQPALEVAQDVHLLTVKFFEREELGEVKLSILKEGNDNACIECRDGHAHYSTRIIQLQTTALHVVVPTVAAKAPPGWSIVLVS